MCWACGFHYGTKYDIRRSDASWHEILRCWDKIPLQRCHISPSSLGGTDEEANLFLMCRECHDRMPNTSISQIFFEWARAQNSNVRETAKIRDALDAFCFENAAWQDLERTINLEEFKSWSRDKFGLHRPQSNYAPVSSRLTPATLVGLAAYYCRIFQSL